MFLAVKGYFKALSLLDQVMRFLVILTFKRNRRRNPTILHSNESALTKLFEKGATTFSQN